MTPILPMLRRLIIIEISDLEGKIKDYKWNRTSGERRTLRKVTQIT
jgi:hypothetical protein